MKPASIVSGRGSRSSVDDAALAAAPRSGHIRTAGLDAYDGEPSVFAEYIDLQNMTLPSHLGSATGETRDAMGHRAPDSVVAVLIGRRSLKDVVT
jgi:lactate dehydrogenase-like 2-hydroxyacid dehydrogenase